MTWFSVRTISMSTVPAASDDIWQLLTNPTTLAELTPLVRSIEASGSNWLWKLNGIEALGIKIEAAFTERMDFIERTELTDSRQIVFAHDPPPRSRERAAVEGIYDLTPEGTEATELKVDLTLSVNLPLPRLSRFAVESVITSSMRLTGERFASNLYQRLGLDPKTVSITELAIPR